jgi:hypothetical protein
VYYCDKHYNDDAPQECKDNMPSPETKRMQREAEAEEKKRRRSASAQSVSALDQFDDSRSAAGSTANSSINGIQVINQYSQIEDDIIRLCRDTGQTQFIYNQLMEFSNDSGRQSQSPYITGAMQSSCSISHPMEYPDEYSDD